MSEKKEAVELVYKTQIPETEEENLLEDKND